MVMAHSAPTAARVTLTAPISGYLISIDQVPDPVFAEKMVGDGISIDPTSEVLCAPCAGEVIQLHPANHAITLKTAEGIEILMHIGLDTVMLKGEGFRPIVGVGDRVQVGDRLIEFDADAVALNAKSLLTQVVITNMERVSELSLQTGSVTVAQNPVLEVLVEGHVPGTTANGKTEADDDEIVVSEPITIPNPTGLHARPAAVLSTMAKQYTSTIHLQRGDTQANARSVTSIMGLQVEHGDRVTLVAKGADAKAAITALSEAVSAGLGEESAVAIALPASIAQSELKAPPPRPKSDDPDTILGVAASPGLAVGHIQHVRQVDIRVTETATDAEQEKHRLQQAIAQATLEVESLRASIHGHGNPGKAAIFAAHQELLDDPALLEMAMSAIAKGKSAEFAWKQTYHSQAAHLAGLQNELLAQRANDLRDVGMRVLRLLTGADVETHRYPLKTILVAEDLTPSDMAALEHSNVIGFCTLAGGATSHVAILARAMGMPAIAGAEPRIMELANNIPVILDGTKGTLRLNVSPEELRDVKQQIEQQIAKQDADLRHAFNPAITTDGHRVEVVANIAKIKDAEDAISLGGEGVGLLRSEFVFMDRTAAPSEDEQTGIYRSILEVLGRDRPMVLRTLDIGGDKPLPYLSMPREENPFLGERGIRLQLDQPELFRTQLRAILRASTVGTLRVMFPMIGRVEELQMAKTMLEEERQKLGVAPIEVGIMVEVPSAAVMAEQFAKEVDFFSIGTNDLTQYTLAMDRGHPKLAPYVDALHPAVLRLINLAVQGAGRYGKWVGVCGGIAGDPQAVPLLIGLGVKELSVSVPLIPSIKAQVRELSLAHCQKLAGQAIALETAAEVRALYALPNN